VIHCYKCSKSLVSLLVSNDEHCDTDGEVTMGCCLDYAKDGTHDHKRNQRAMLATLFASFSAGAHPNHASAAVATT
jgi:hypothetical protein